jgi:hypothetical protein
MSNLQYRQEKIQQKRKQTSWRDFVRDKMSRKSLNYNKVDGLVSRFPQTDRIPPLLSITQLNDIIDTVSTTYHLDYDSNYTFFQQIQQLFSLVPQPALIHYTPNE